MRRPLNNLKYEKEDCALKVSDFKIRKTEQEKIETVLKSDVSDLEMTVAEGDRALTALGDLKAR